MATSLMLFIATFLLTLLGGLLFPYLFLRKMIKRWGLSKIPREMRKSKKAVVIGLDGMAPDIVERLFAEGRLPNLAALKQEGGYRRLRTTDPPESPVAWSSFLTGCNPGKHSVFDFLSRNLANYLPTYAIAETTPPRWVVRLGRLVLALTPPKTLGLRRQKPFWAELAERGLPTVIQRVPVTFPPEPYDGRLLSAMGVPDLLGTQGTFTYFTSRSEPGEVEEGGRVIRLDQMDETYFAKIPGPEDPVSLAPRISEIAFSLSPSSGEQAEIMLDGEAHQLKQGKYSEWIELKFSRQNGARPRGIVKFLLKSLSPSVELYMTPINIDPEKPSIPISHPPFYSKYLSLATGKFNTLGLAEDTWAFNENRLTPEEFLEQCEGIFEERRKIFDLELARMRRGLLVHVFDITDRVQHMFWQYTDPGHPLYDKDQAKKFGGVIDTTYEKMDDLIGEVRNQLSAGDLLLVLSDHGFNSFRYAVNLNTWLYREGYLALEKGHQTSPKFFRRVDWKNTKAYALGLNGLYINLKGRESEGVVSSSESADLKRELKEKLESYVDEALGFNVFHTAHIREETFWGDWLSHAPDLVVGYNKNFRASWQTTLGAIPPEVVEENRKNWSGDHCISAELIPGVLFCNREIVEENPSIMDVGPSILSEYCLETPARMDGKSFIAHPTG